MKKPLIVGGIGVLQTIVGLGVFWTWASFSLIYVDRGDHTAQLRWCSYWIYGGLAVAAIGILMIFGAAGTAVVRRLRG